MVKNVLRRAFGLLLIFTILCGGIYTAVVTGAAALLFPFAANGSLVEASGLLEGSALIGQPYASRRHLWGRPGPQQKVELAGGGSAVYGGPANAAVTSQAYAERIRERAIYLQKANGMDGIPVPEDLLTDSGSGLDPDISPAAAQYQVHRLAAATGHGEDEIEAVLTACTQQRFLGIFGAPRVNVSAVNRMLDAMP